MEGIDVFRLVVVVLWLASIAWLIYELTRQPMARQTTSRRRGMRPVGSTDGELDTERLAEARAEHERKGHAATVRVAGQGAAPQASTRVSRPQPVASNQQKATRMEELGFHVGVKPIDEHSTAPASVPAAASTQPTPVQSPTEALPLRPSAPAVTAPAAAPAVQAAAPAAAPAADPITTRLHTQDLDSILARIDAVLSDSAVPAAPAAAAAPAPAPAVAAAPARPAWARPGAEDKDLDKPAEGPGASGGQQRLF